MHEISNIKTNHNDLSSLIRILYCEQFLVPLAAVHVIHSAWIFLLPNIDSASWDDHYCMRALFPEQCYSRTGKSQYEIQPTDKLTNTSNYYLQESDNGGVWPSPQRWVIYCQHQEIITQWKQFWGHWKSCLRVSSYHIYMYFHMTYATLLTVNIALFWKFVPKWPI